MSGRTPRSKVLRVLIADSRKLLGHGLMAILRDVPDLRVVGLVESGENLAATIQEMEPHVLITATSLNGQPVFPMLRTLLGGATPPHVIALAESDDVGQIMDVLDAGADGFIGQQIGSDELVAGIRVVASGGQFIDGAYARRLRELRASAKADGANGRHGHDHGGANGRHSHDHGGANGGRSSWRLTGISSRESEILAMIGEGLTNKDIAERLHISVRTVETHRAHLKQKLSARTTADLVRRAIRVES